MDTAHLCWGWKKRMRNRVKSGRVAAINEKLSKFELT